MSRSTNLRSPVPREPPPAFQTACFGGGWKSDKTNQKARPSVARALCSLETHVYGIKPSKQIFDMSTNIYLRDVFVGATKISFCFAFSKICLYQRCATGKERKSATDTKCDGRAKGPRPPQQLCAYSSTDGTGWELNRRARKNVYMSPRGQRRASAFFPSLNVLFERAETIKQASSHTIRSLMKSSSALLVATYIKCFHSSGRGFEASSQRCVSLPIEASHFQCRKANKGVPRTSKTVPQRALVCSTDACVIPW